MSSGAADRLSR